MELKGLRRQRISHGATETNGDGYATKVTKDTKPFDGPPKAARATRRSRKQATLEILVGGAFDGRGIQADQQRAASGSGEIGFPGPRNDANVDEDAACCGMNHSSTRTA